MCVGVGVGVWVYVCVGVEGFALFVIIMLLFVIIMKLLKYNSDHFLVYIFFVFQT